MNDYKVAVLANNFHRAECIRKDLGIAAYTLCSTMKFSGRGLMVDTLVVDEDVNWSNAKDQFAAVATYIYRLERIMS